MACRKSGGAVIEDDQHTGDRLKAYLASQVNNNRRVKIKF
jgi:hypothetical protein